MFARAGGLELRAVAGDGAIDFHADGVDGRLVA